jgi:hypothetical protein
LNLICGHGQEICVNMVTFFLKLEIAEKFGVYQVIPFSAFNILREEGMDPKNPSYVRFKYDAAAAAGYGTTAGGWASYALEEQKE